MPRVAHFISTNGVYGAERWILALLRYIDNSLIIVPSTSNTALLAEAEKLGIQTRVLNVKGNFALPSFIRGLNRIIKKEKIKILHTHGYKADIIGLAAARLSNIKIISTPHGWSTNADTKLKFYEALDKQILRFFDLVIPHTKFFKKTLPHLKKTIWIDNFVDLKTIPKPKKGDPKLITYIGQLIERKRVQDLISALSYLPDHKLQIIGDGPLNSKLRQLATKLNIQDRIEFKGFRNDRLELLNKSQILVLPSLMEFIPRCVMEAMAMKKAIICTDIPGNKPLINKDTGILVPERSPKDIADAIDLLTNNRNKLNKLGVAASEHIKQSFSAETAADKFKAIYRSLR